ncbi:MAG: hypothetical protein L0241_00675 [Planctomycetia bacterium]|nr:hypothetical protein [Planctomycetia bacterium]
MFGMFGLGIQELIVLLFCAGVPATVAVIAIVLTRQARQKKSVENEYSEDE